MTAVALISAKHAPGVTTATVAFALAAGDGALAVEADVSGGDIAARARLTTEPGLVTMAAASRHAGSRVKLQTQVLASGAEVVVAPTDPQQSSTALAAIGDRLPDAVREHGGGFLDCGRWSPVTSIRSLLAGCDAIVVVTGPSVAGIEHVRCRTGALAELGPTLAVLLVGDRPYGPAEVEEALALPVIGALAVDHRGTLSIYGGPAPLARKSTL